MRSRLSPFAVLLALLVGGAGWAEDDERKVIEEGKSVGIEYTLKLDDGTTADTNVGREPLVYEQGGGQILPALEKELEGLSVGDTKEVVLSAEDGYGPVDPELRQEVDAERVPEEARSPGSHLMSRHPSGAQRLVRVHEVRDDKVVLDFNHPLAGQKLHFAVKVLSIE